MPLDVIETGDIEVIHNTFLVRISTRQIIAATQYWPVDVDRDELNEFISTREELRTEPGQVSELPLVVGDHKFLGKDWIEDSVLVFVTDKGEDEGSTFEKIDLALKALRTKFKKEGIEGAVKNYAILIEPSVTTRLKIALVGEGGVGKTTTLHLLLGDTPPLQYVPTIALNLETVENIRFGNYSLVLWDFAGQERFRTLWRFYFHGADVIFLVCDSTLRNVIISKDILKLIKRDAPKVPVFAMANKQDKPNAMKPEVVQKVLGIPTYPMVAIDKERRDEMLRILMNAAAQYVGVALPDLPASELLKFTEAATEEAIAETSHAEMVEVEKAEAEEEYEEAEEYEEVYVDEEGHVIENLEEYEIIEEGEEEIVEEEFEVEEEPAEIEETPAEEAEASLVEPEVEAAQLESEVTEAEEVEEPMLEEEIEIEALIGDATEEIAIQIEQEPESGPAIESVQEHEPIELDMETTVVASEDLGPALVEEITDAAQMAKDIIFEALEADDFDNMIAQEIDHASDEDLDTALQAIGSDETIPFLHEPEEPSEIDAESLEELEAFLGPLDRSVGGTGTAESKTTADEEEDEDTPYLPLNGETLAELDKLLDSNDDETESE
ncbi:MAG: GTP-binding protein [Candidatus Thorarchaeota archaeon]|nr:GTP-binding protein [Candidatus Thorarchaeota archaeon]